MKSQMLFSVILAALVAGCGGGGLGPVSGVVYLDNKPLAGASVSFQPIASEGTEAGLGSYGKTDEQGRYNLMTIEGDRSGAVVGKHRVQISIPISAPSNRDDLPGGATMRDKLHANYNQQSKLTFTVPEGGTDSADFKLTSKGDVP